MLDAAKLDQERKEGKLRGPLHGLPIVMALVPSPSTSDLYLSWSKILWLWKDQSRSCQRMNRSVLTWEIVKPTSIAQPYVVRYILVALLQVTHQVCAGELRLTRIGPTRRKYRYQEAEVCLTLAFVVHHEAIVSQARRRHCIGNKYVKGISPLEYTPHLLLKLILASG